MTDRVGGYTIEEAARRLGHLRWLEMRLFELLAAWASDTADHEVKLRYLASSRFHGWHAELLAERLPEVRELSPARQTVPPSVAVAELLAELTALDDPLDRAVVLARVVLPRLVGAYSAHLDHCTPVADASVIRTLGFIVADLLEDWRVGERHAQSMLVDVDAVAAAGRIQQRIEAAVVAAGGISGA